MPPADLNYTRRRSVIPDTGWYGGAVDTVRPEAIKPVELTGIVRKLAMVAEKQ
jgi:hypothetical protein